MPPALETTTRDSSFASTRWTVVRQAADSQTASQHALSALSELCQIYWRPVYLFLRRHGFAQHDAQDLTQGFFAQLIENRAYASADPIKGRFRSFLLGIEANKMAQIGFPTDLHSVGQHSNADRAPSRLPFHFAAPFRFDRKDGIHAITVVRRSITGLQVQAVHGAFHLAGTQVLTSEIYWISVAVFVAVTAIYDAR